MYGPGGGGRTVRVGGGDGGTFDAKYFKCIEALHRNEGWPAPPGVTSERRLEGLCIHFLICCLLSVCNIFTTPTAAYHRPNLERAHKVLAQLVKFIFLLHISSK